MFPIHYMIHYNDFHLVVSTYISDQCHPLRVRCHPGIVDHAEDVVWNLSACVVGSAVVDVLLLLLLLLDEAVVVLLITAVAIWYFPFHRDHIMLLLLLLVVQVTGGHLLVQVSHVSVLVVQDVRRVVDVGRAIGVVAFVDLVSIAGGAVPWFLLDDDVIFPLCLVVAGVVVSGTMVLCGASGGGVVHTDHEVRRQDTGVGS